MPAEFRVTLGGAEYLILRHDDGSFELPPDLARWAGFGTALKPAWEPILVYRKPVEAGTIAEQVLATGTGALNIDATRIRHSGEADLAAHQQGVAALKAKGGSLGGSWKNSSDLSGASDVSTAGRWPPNVILTHSDACRRVGERQVKGPVMVTFDEGMKPFGDAVGAKHTAEQRPDETVAVYACAPHCPVRLLDEQAGSLHSAGNKQASDVGKMGYHGAKGQKVNPDYHQDKGGASRFFPGFEPLDAPFLYTAKAATKETNIAAGTQLYQLKGGLTPEKREEVLARLRAAGALS